MFKNITQHYIQQKSRVIKKKQLGKFVLFFLSSKLLSGANEAFGEQCSANDANCAMLRAQRSIVASSCSVNWLFEMLNFVEEEKTEKIVFFLLKENITKSTATVFDNWTAARNQRPLIARQDAPRLLSVGQARSCLAVTMQLIENDKTDVILMVEIYFPWIIIIIIIKINQIVCLQQ